MYSKKKFIQTGESMFAINADCSKLPFFCIPPAAGLAKHFEIITQYLDPDQPMYIIEALGLDGKNEPHTNIKDIAAYNIEKMMSVQPEGPYLLGGRCFGARVVYEMAQQLISAGKEIAILVIFDTYPPNENYSGLKNNRIKRDPENIIGQIKSHLKSGDLLKVAKNYTSNEFSKTVKKIKQNAKLNLSTPRLKLNEKIRQIHIKSQDTYTAEKYPGKIIIIESGDYKTETRDRWRDLALGGLETYSIPGSDHNTISKEPYRRLFIEKLNFILERAQKEIGNKILLENQI